MGMHGAREQEFLGACFWPCVAERFVLGGLIQGRLLGT